MAEKEPDKFDEPESIEAISALKEDVSGLTESCRALFTKDELSEVNYYLNHNEPEMALEGLLIELINANQRPASINSETWTEIVQTAGLRNGGVFDYDIWDKFCLWLDQT